VILQVLYEGIINGATLALIAMGIALVWGVMNILSFSQGEFLMLGMYITFWINYYWGLDPLVALPICMIIMFGFGWLIYKTMISRALRGPVLSQRLITFALSMVLVNGALMAFSGEFRTIPNLAFEGTIRLGPLNVTKQKLVPLLVSLAITGALFFFINKTKMGKAIQATSMNKDSALLMGINTERAYAVAFAISSAIAGAAGCALSYYFYIYPSVGTSFQLFGFLAVAIGGFGSIPGAFVGGIIMGLVDTIIGTYLSPSFKYAAVCIAYVLIVSFRPKGLFGR